ncbi:MAG: carboxymuconolactone decarboxylase family protein [Deltaproteobacteria bacterium]|nr:carboxymuconolactone decarboxylase family protein [Deltaproteobacteria bacterium]
MEDQKPSVEQILKHMAENLGEEPKPMVLMSKLIPEMVPRQAQDRKFVMELPHIPPKYKQLIMIAVAAAVSSHKCTETFIKLASRAGISKEEITEAIITARFALGSTVFAAATEGMEYLVAEEG